MATNAAKRPIDRADAGEAHRVADHEPDHARGGRAERHADADLAGPLPDRERQHAVEPGHAQRRGRRPRAAIQSTTRRGAGRSAASATRRAAEARRAADRPQPAGTARRARRLTARRACARARAAPTRAASPARRQIDVTAIPAVDDEAADGVARDADDGERGVTREDRRPAGRRPARYGWSCRSDPRWARTRAPSRR